MMKIKALLYCTKAKNKNDYLTKAWKNLYELASLKEVIENDTLNGKIVCECEVETEEIEWQFNLVDYEIIKEFKTKTMLDTELYKRSCLLGSQIDEYLKDKNGYALHLSNVKERVMGLGYICKEKSVWSPIKQAPQNMMWVYVNENGKWVKYLLISVRPQWLCLILNGKKDIEVRRKVLKGMCE